ncbi:hypothetical protein O181_066201 [Austropuccinia psidii MF-1]|uniref:Protein phosphatase n=1 Tax=Austropuccinia psidii MF-1 TaxID=1389203 RepID=A0A9Q3EQG8_9BASI|nr:hypothetical protein [Austropuccinia psidii MF-1]
MSPANPHSQQPSSPAPVQLPSCLPLRAGAPRKINRLTPPTITKPGHLSREPTDTKSSILILPLRHQIRKILQGLGCTQDTQMLHQIKILDRFHKYHHLNRSHQRLFSTNKIHKINANCQFISAASFLGKPTSQSPQDLKSISTHYQKWVLDQKTIWSQTYLSRHPNLPSSNFHQLTNSGHDWWFINQSKQTGVLSLGVADGVGGWEEQGLDPAQVSQSLMFYSNHSLNSSPKNPSQVLSTAYQKILDDDLVGGGATTALLARLDPHHLTLEWANLGDSSLMIFKNQSKNLELLSNSQTHYFNCPYQLTKFPKGSSSKGFVTDTPEMAHCGSVPIHNGDLILLFTDGLGDNLFPEDIRIATRHVLSKGLADSDFIQELAHTLCFYARVVSFQSKRVTPFEVEARKHNIHDMTGGKVDDVTLVASLVRLPEQSN